MRTFSRVTNTRHVATSVDERSGARRVEEHALTPVAIEQVILLTERDDAQEQHTALVREAKDLDKRIARLVVAVASSSGRPAI